MHSGHYLHLPVIDGAIPVGLVDVQQLTLAMLSYLVSKESLQETTGPMWGAFWNSTLTLTADETESVDSSPRRLSRTPSLHQSFQVPSTPTPTFIQEEPVFKIKDGKRILYMTEKYSDYREFTNILWAKVGFQCEFSYQDEDGDDCCIECSSDLEQAVALARRTNGKVIILVKRADDFVEKFNQVPVGLQVAAGLTVVLISAFVLKRLFD